MHPADLRLVIIDQASDPALIRRADDHLFFQLAPHPFFIGALLSGIIRRNMPPNANAPLGMQPSFTLTLPARVLKDPRPSLRIAIPETHVGDELLMARDVFHRRPGATTR